MMRTEAVVEPGRANSEFLDSESFVTAMEEALDVGESTVVDANLPTLKRLITDLATRKKELESLETRARDVHRRQGAAKRPGRYVRDHSGSSPAK